MKLSHEAFGRTKLIFNAIVAVLLLASSSVNGWSGTTTTSPLVSRHFSSQQRQQARHRKRLGLTRCYSQKDDFKHTLAILSMPSTSTDKIANEAILNQAVQHTRKLSVVLRARGDKHPSLARLRRYVGEVYSTMWDVAMASGTPDFCDVVVYPQNLPNAAPEQWIHHAADLDSVCSHDSICGWVSSSAQGRGLQFQSISGDGFGGLDAHVQALNADRAQRDLPPVKAMHVDPWPLGANAETQKENHIGWLDDEHYEEIEGPLNSYDDDECDTGDDFQFDPEGACDQIGGASIPEGVLYEKVAVGGTFDGMHYGHRKLLTLAVSSVNPSTGKLLIGVTVDDMLKHKAYASEIPPMNERMKFAKEFVYRLAPGIKNRVRLVPIEDEYGPPGQEGDGKDFDALVLSHETLYNGWLLNQHRTEDLGYEPLALLCTRRTEPHGMSSTALRRIRYNKKQKAKI